MGVDILPCREEKSEAGFGVNLLFLESRDIFMDAFVSSRMTDTKVEAPDHASAAP